MILKGQVTGILKSSRTVYWRVTVIQELESLRKEESDPEVGKWLQQWVDSKIWWEIQYWRFLGRERAKNLKAATEEHEGYLFFFPDQGPEGITGGWEHEGGGRLGVKGGGERNSFKIKQEQPHHFFIRNEHIRTQEGIIKTMNEIRL